MLGKAIHPKIAYRGEVLQSIDGAYGSKEERKMHEFFDGIEGENIEIGDGVKPEDVSEEDAPIIKYVHSVIKDALEMRASDIHMEPLEKSFAYDSEWMEDCKSNQTHQNDCSHRLFRELN